MSQQATVTDHVTYRPGEGALQEIPPGPVEVDIAPDSATLSWKEDNGAAGLTAIPITEFIDYVHDHKIELE
ncbi:hypothetical protein [Rhodoferax saidenbachensis]|uniref:Uncharacterized protein n=1 Tax=Rhodoferax saidenbachensis TaxID=1484693 RepID=A0A1P8KCA3_9BURK|nr:hypothetical protein [Rhodoferax saidenbachensis]APW43608.1 hypothetical protein RS694_14420 [Rhodoferax saidenbachensis]